MKWMSYKEASELVCSLGIQTIGELKAFCKSDSRPRNFPRAPGARIWWKKDEWRGLPAFLGRVRIHGWKIEKRMIEKRKREWMFGLARDWLKGGKTFMREIAKMMGVCKQTVYEVIHFGNRSREAVPMVNLSAMNVRIISEYNKPVDVVN